MIDLLNDGSIRVSGREVAEHVHKSAVRFDLHGEGPIAQDALAACTREVTDVVRQGDRAEAQLQICKEPGERDVERLVAEESFCWGRIVCIHVVKPLGCAP